MTLDQPTAEEKAKREYSKEKIRMKTVKTDITKSLKRSSNAI